MASGLWAVRLLLAAVLLILTALLAGVSRPQDFSAIFESFECPEAPACAPDVRDVCGRSGWAIRLAQPMGEFDATATITIQCGERLVDQAIEGCLKVSAINTDPEGLASVEPSRIAYGGDECVPEPSVGLMVAVGCLGLATFALRDRGSRRSPARRHSAPS